MTIDWQNLSFLYQETNSFICYSWKNGQWDKGELSSQYNMSIHVGATCLHYGQAVFEGLKAFRSKDGTINVFRPQENAKRFNKSCSRILMPNVEEELFLEAIEKVILANREFIPPYGTGCSLYIRPLMIGTGPKIGVEASDEYKFIVLVLPVGSYYKDGLSSVDAIIIDGYSRAASNGVGNVKVAGNYAASLKPSKIAQSKGYPINLYLDAKEGKFIDEFGTSNFIALKDDEYITPTSNSILESITNLSLMTIAQDMGLKVNRRQVLLEEVNSFKQIAACGTAVVITPINDIYYNDKTYRAKSRGIDPVLNELYHRVLDIQHGDAEDIYKWNWQINE